MGASQVSRPLSFFAGLSALGFFSTAALSGELLPFISPEVGIRTGNTTVIETGRIAWVGGKLAVEGNPSTEYLRGWCEAWMQAQTALEVPSHLQSSFVVTRPDGEWTCPESQP